MIGLPALPLSHRKQLCYKSQRAAGHYAAPSEMSTAKVCSSRLHRAPSPNPAGMLAEYRRRCEKVQRAPIEVLPCKIDLLLNALDSATEEQAIAADQCSCPLCMQLLFDGSRAPHGVCSICRRRCCNVCSSDTNGPIVCRAQTCVAVSKFNGRQLSLDALAVECERISRNLLRQWVVLQFKGEIQLGPLRALILVDAKNAALSCLAAKSSLGQRRLGLAAESACAQEAEMQ